MKQTTAVANALDGISKTFYVTTEDGISTLALDIQVQWSSILNDPILDLIQDRLQSMYTEIMEALQKDSQEKSE